MSSSFGIAVPYGSPTLVMDRLAAGGEPALFQEVFDRQSWAKLPGKVRVCRSHNRDAPLGWGRLRNTDAGLEVRIDWADTTVARDAHAEVKAGLMLGLSVSFIADPSKDEVSREPGRVPVVRRRGCELAEVSLVNMPAYPGAKITSADHDEEQHNLAELAAARSTPDMVAFIERRKATDAELLRPGRERIEARRRQEAADVELVASAAALVTETRRRLAPDVSGDPGWLVHLPHRGRFLVPRSQARTQQQAERCVLDLDASALMNHVEFDLMYAEHGVERVS